MMNFMRLSAANPTFEPYRDIDSDTLHLDRSYKVRNASSLIRPTYILRNNTHSSS